jgi:hypothetical protein
LKGGYNHSIDFETMGMGMGIIFITSIAHTIDLINNSYLFPSIAAEAGEGPIFHS